MSIMRVYQMNECDTVAAKSLEEAIEFYKTEFGEDSIDDPHEVSLGRKMWNEYNGTDEDKIKQVFSLDEHIETVKWNMRRFKMIDGILLRKESFLEVLSNSKEEEPFIIASTEY